MDCLNRTISTMDSTDAIGSDYEEMSSSENISADESEGSQSTERTSGSCEESETSDEEEIGIEYTEDDMESIDEDFLTDEETKHDNGDKATSLRIETYSSSDLSSESDVETDCQDKQIVKSGLDVLNESDNNVEKVNYSALTQDYLGQERDLKELNENATLKDSRCTAHSCESLGSYLEMPSTEIMSEEEIRHMFSLGSSSKDQEISIVKPAENVSHSLSHKSQTDCVHLTPKESFCRLYGKTSTPIQMITSGSQPAAMSNGDKHEKPSKHYSTPVVPRMKLQYGASYDYISSEKNQLFLSEHDKIQPRTALVIDPAISERSIPVNIPPQTCSLPMRGVQSQPGNIGRTLSEGVSHTLTSTPTVVVGGNKENCNKKVATIPSTVTGIGLVPGETDSRSGSEGIHFNKPNPAGNFHTDNCIIKESSCSQDKRTKKRERIIQEILHTEKTYQNHLRLIIQYFEEPLREKQIIPGHVIVTIFSNIRQIISVNQELFQHLTTHQIGEAFLLLGPFLKLYSTYANNHERALATMIEWDQKSPEFAAFRRAQEEEEEMSALKLNALLITPVQRIPRYKLLLEELSENTAIDHPDYSAIQEAVKQISAVANHINEHIRRQDNVMKMLAIQKSLAGHNTPRLLTPGRIFIKEGTLKKVSKKGGRSYERKFFLFSDMLMYAKPKLLEGGGHHSYVCCCILPLQHCTVTTVFGHSQGKSALFRIGCKQESLLLFSDQKTVDCWVLVLKSAIGAFQESRQTLRKASSAKQPVRGAELARLRRQEKRKDPLTAANRHTPEKVASPSARTFRDLLSSPLSRALQRPTSSPGQLQTPRSKNPKSVLKENAINNQHGLRLDLGNSVKQERSLMKKTDKRSVETVDYTNCLLPRKRKRIRPEISEPVPRTSPVDMKCEGFHINQSEVWVNDSEVSCGEHSQLSVIPETSFYSPASGERSQNADPVVSSSAKNNMSGSEWSFISKGVDHTTNSDRSTVQSECATPRTKATYNRSWDKALDTATAAARLVNGTSVHAACCLQ